jgi:hypothetical protein
MRDDIYKLYELIEKLKATCCERFHVTQWLDITLSNIGGRQPYWNECRKGLYLFFDNREKCADGNTPRIVRIGTHGIKKAESKSTLWGRLKQHKGNEKNGRGNHRGSIFRLLVGEALINRDSNGPVSWGIGSSAPNDTRQQEIEHEIKVSAYIKELPFLVIKIDNRDDRKFLEDNLIALLSNINRRQSDPPCPDDPSRHWLGRHSCRPLVRSSGLWNNQGVQDTNDPNFLELLAKYIGEM